MSLLDQLRDAQTEPARHRTSPFAGPSILTLAQLRAMERVLLREMPGYGPEVLVPHEQHEQQGRPGSHEPHEPRAPRANVELEPLALWSPPSAVAPAVPVEPALPVAPAVPVEPAVALESGPLDPAPLPVWAPPTEDPVPRRRQPDPCPSCGEAVSIGRIDLTANASWFSCRRCGLRWGGAIERTDADSAVAG